jgi:serine protease Do
MRSFGSIVLGAVLGSALGVAAVTSGWAARLGLRTAPAPALSEPRATESAEPLTSAGRPAERLVDPSGHSLFALLAREAAPGVVNVHTSRTVRVVGPGMGGPLDELFREFFGGPPPGMPREGLQRSLGSGFVVSADGLVVTNDHVVNGVDRITVIFKDGTEAEAEIVGQDAKTDLALLRVRGRTDLHPLRFGDSDAVLPGDWAVAIGNPFGLDHTVTVGIVSAIGRDLGQTPYDDFIQTDAAINPGNSGGPLLNLAGEVIGINNQINPQANTIGFAVPSNLAREIIPQLQDHGRVTRGWLGVAVQPITPELAEAMQLGVSEGALVTQVAPSSPAAAAGVERGDAIVRFGEQPIARPRDLSRAVARTAVGQEVLLEIARRGERQTLRVTIQEMADEQGATRRSADRGGLAELGLRVQDLTPALREQLGFSGEGVLVAEVDPEGPAAALRPGDVVLEVDRQPVRNTAELLSRVRAGGPSLLFLVQRGGGAVYVVVERDRR